MIFTKYYRYVLSALILVSMADISFAAENLTAAFRDGELKGVFKTLWFQRNMDGLGKGLLGVHCPGDYRQ